MGVGVPFDTEESEGETADAGDFLYDGAQIFRMGSRFKSSGERLCSRAECLLIASAKLCGSILMEVDWLVEFWSMEDVGLCPKAQALAPLFRQPPAFPD